MSDQNPIKTQTIWAEPYTARQCPECETWVYTDAGPFSEGDGDRTKTVADWLHWERFHFDGDPTDFPIRYPFFTYNDTPVEATLEYHPASTEAPASPDKGTVTERLNRLQDRPGPEPPDLGT